MEPAIMLWGVLFSSVGVGYVIYGRKQHKLIPLVSGVGLILGPWFIDGVGLLLGLGVLLLALPFVIRN